MKIAVGVLRAVTLVAVLATSAFAEWRLFVNRHSRVSVEGTFSSSDDCYRAVQSVYTAGGGVVNAWCALYASGETSPPPPPPPFLPEHRSPDPPLGYPRSPGTGYGPITAPPASRAEEPIDRSRAEEIIDRATGYTPDPPPAASEPRVQDLPIAIVVPLSEEERLRREAEMARSMAETEKVMAAIAEASARAEAASRDAAATEARTKKRAALTIAALVALTIVAVFAYGVFSTRRRNRREGSRPSAA